MKLFKFYAIVLLVSIAASITSCKKDVNQPVSKLQTVKLYTTQDSSGGNQPPIPPKK